MTVKDYMASLECALVSSDHKLSEPELREWCHVIQEVEDFHKASFIETVQQLKRPAEAAPTKAYGVRG
jgi:hypothetical protein